MTTNHNTSQDNPQPPTELRRYLDRFVQRMQVQHFAAGTVTLRRNYVERFLVWCDERGITTLAEITRDIIHAYQRHLYHARHAKTGLPLRVTYQVSLLLPLRAWFRYLVQERVTDTNPTLDLELPRDGQRLPAHVLTISEVERILNVPDVTTALGLRDRAMLEVLYATAMRRSELVKLLVYDLDRERGVVTIRHGKGDKDRTVPLGKRALEWLSCYVDQARPGLTEHSTATQLFVSCNGHGFSSSNVSNLMAGYIRAAGVTKKGSCHIFRHTTATLMLEHGADLRSLQTLLGHASVTTTQIYTHVSITHLKQVHEQTHPANLPRPDTGDSTTAPAVPPSRPSVLDDAPVDDSSGLTE